MELNNGGALNYNGPEAYMLNALQHSTEVWQVTKGNVNLSIWKVNH
jgi:hypothetical protein